MARSNSRFSTLEKEEKRPLNKDNFKKLLGVFRFILPYKTGFIVGLVLLLFTSGILLSFPYVAGKLIDVASGKGSWLLNDITSIALALIGILLVQSIVSFFRVYFFATVSERTVADIRTHLYQKLIRLPITFYDSKRTGELISRITSDVTMIQDTFTVTLAELIRQTSILIIGLGLIFYTMPSLSVFMLATFPVLILAAMFFGRFIRKMSKKTQDALANASVVAEETLQSVHTVKAFTNEQYEIKRYRASMSAVVKVALKTATYRAGFISFVIFALFGGIVGVMWYGATLVQNGELTVGDLLSFVLYTTFIGGSIAGLGDLFGQIQKAIGASERILEILEETEEVESKEQESINIEGEIAYENVTFSYPTRKEMPVLKSISFHVPHGSKVALVGQSGAGKSTIIQLLMRFYQPDTGKILIDGKDNQSYSISALRKHIGIVPQEVILFGGTILENIRYGKPDATEDEVVEAARQANALDFILSFPEQFDTIVGERGIKLSGGQRQRIAIARAILKNPSILILDEATSSLDAESERLVQDALEKLMKDRTTIIIAHRLATIRKVDRIYVIGDGQITEEGTHDELTTDEEGKYSQLVKLQLEVS
ncbi:MULTISPECIES: ABC transporter ATP-binding protein [unclassified Imperialibacter]|uniref:ABC transporter ATP-binding protein n=1 Tax=unclassified Imperialibacter TaxID=2629706 RepID=UPI001257D062|nr:MULTISPECIES: ABC transporter transmembrane domain-containing protein [unclassified Imperialibacter]CAD5290075.1 ABC transporter related protein [Imperialibacter sp. 89]CAD5290361.1 ABC transporter related protein [Imperialibacter sp. 75]VVT34500.1 ABC transporter related protein [Imperialibacter sp. EC-SDR9]